MAEQQADRNETPTPRIRLSERARALKTELTALWYASQDPRLPLRAKAAIALTLAYALSPIDLIPDFIPVLGYLDDLILVPALITLSIRLIPAPLLADARARAQDEPLKLPKNPLTAAVFIAFWSALLGLLVFSLYKKFAT